MQILNLIGRVLETGRMRMTENVKVFTFKIDMLIVLTIIVILIAIAYHFYEERKLDKKYKETLNRMLKEYNTIHTKNLSNALLDTYISKWKKIIDQEFSIYDDRYWRLNELLEILQKLKEDNKNE